MIAAMRSDNTVTCQSVPYDGENHFKPYHCLYVQDCNYYILMVTL